jgi:TolB-like protein/Tfp pilus assembly protein PilF
VNVAARLEGLAEPGGICVSSQVHGEVRHKLGLDFEDLGEQSVKNIPDPVRVFRIRLERPAPPRSRAPTTRRRWAILAGLLIALAGGAALWRLLTPPGLGPVPGFGGAPAIAVLPFDNLSGDPEQEYFADGISEDVITRLSSGSFPVIARNSTFTYKGSPVNVQQVGRELGARYVVEGSVRRAGDRIRISAQLIDSTNGHHVWAETYDRELEDLFAVQDEITQSIAGAVGGRLIRAESDRAASGEPRNLDAYDFLMRGLWHFFKLTAEDNEKARSLFEQAIELNPSNAGSWASLASTHFFDILFQWSDSPARSLEGLERAARRCVAVNAQHARCQLVMGQLASLTGQREEMFAAYEAAVRIAPSHPGAHFNLGVYAAVTGRPEEGLMHIEKAIRLSPKDRMLGTYFYGVAIAHFAAGRYKTAVAWAQRSVTLAPEFMFGHLALVVSNAQLGRRDDAGAALEGLLRVQPELSPATIRRAFSTSDPELVALLIEGVRIAGLREE